MAFTIDVDEGKWSKDVLKILLIDRTTKRNIIWGTDDYKPLGKEYNEHYPILFELITGENSDVIQPRILKTIESQGNRTKGKAEVFTPSWVCNAQNNLVDNAWFDGENIFNKETEKGWETTTEKIKFTDKKDRTWKKYVDERRLEIACGEAPYLVSRYDAVSGEPLEPKDRIGMLDRKMRVVGENTDNESDWLKWSERAFQSVYGFEFQGDSLLIARENLLASYCDYMEEKLNRQPTEKELINIAKIISWNLWQMDGLTYTIPYEEAVEPIEQITMFDFQEKDKKILCNIKDWRAKRIYTFQDLLNKGDKTVKFGVVIGNPPYQKSISEEKLNSSLSKQLFPHYTVLSMEISTNLSSLIIPARWFAGDAQDKSFLKLREFLKNKDTISDLYYYEDTNSIFNDVEIKGGVCYFLSSLNHAGALNFVKISEAKTVSTKRNLFLEGLDIVLTDEIQFSILNKVKNKEFIPLTEITKGRNAFGIIGKDSVVNEASSAEFFKNSCELRCKANVIRYITEDKVTKNMDVFNAYKVFISKSAGAPNTDKKVIGEPYIGGLKSACTDSLIPIGKFDNLFEAESLQKYLKTKFLRYMVSLVKSSQNTTQIVYRFVPMQDFTGTSDIEWSKLINNIDEQLFDKYNLSIEEREHIKNSIKDM